MKSLTEHLWFEVPGRRGFVNVTSTVEKLVRQSGVQEGLCLVNAMHITASVFINDDEPGLHEDYQRWLEWLAPFDAARSVIIIIAPAKITATRITNDKSWDVKLWLRSRMANSTLVRGSRSSTPSSTASATSG